MENEKSTYEKKLEENIEKANGFLSGLFLKNPALILDYDINRKLLNYDGLFYYAITNKLLEKGVEVIDRITLEEEIKTINMFDRYEELGGYRSVTELMALVDVRNADLIVDNWNKWNLVQRYEEKGILNLEKTWSKIVAMNCSQVFAFVEYQANDSEISVVGDLVEESLDMTNDEISAILNGENMGINYGKHCPILNYLTMGIPVNYLTMVTSFTNGGKSSFTMNSIVIPIAEQQIGVTIVANEQLVIAYKLLLMTYVLTEKLNYWKLSRKKLKSGKWSEEDNKMVQKARKIIKEEYSPYIKFYKLFDYDMKKIGSIAKKVSKKGCKVLLYDTMKADTSEGDSTWLSLLNDSKELLQICNKNGLAGVVTFQLKIALKNKLSIIDESALSNGTQVAEVFEEMIGFRDVWDGEYSGQDNDLKPYRLKRDSHGKLTSEKEEIKIDRNDGHKYKIFFHFKTRNDDVGTQLLYRFDGYQNKWIELGYCTVTAKNRY